MQQNAVPFGICTEITKLPGVMGADLVKHRRDACKLYLHEQMSNSESHLLHSLVWVQCVHD